MANNQNSELERYKNLRKELQNSLSSTQISKTSPLPPASSVKSDIDLRAAKEKLERLKSDYRESQWYPDRDKAGNDTKEEDKEGPLMTGLHALSMPLYGIVGASEAVLGKGSVKGISNIWKNIEERGTFGDLLRQYNLPKGVSAPLGFAMDVGLDPVMWATAGASATIPRLALGAKRAGAQGIAMAAKSGALQKTAGLSRLIPGMDTAALTKKAATASKDFDKMVGRDVGKILQEQFDKVTWGEKTDAYLSKSSWGRALMDGFKLSNREWYQSAKTKDAITRLNAGMTKIGKTDSINEVKDILKGIDTSGMREDMQAGISFLRSKIDDGAELATKPGITDRFSEVDIANALKGEAETEEIFKAFQKSVKEIMKEGAGKSKGSGIFEVAEESGPEFYNKMVDSFKNIKIGNKEVGYDMLRQYNRFINVFKIAKIGGNVSAFTNAIVGNLTMAAMSGVSITRPGYFKNVKGAWNLMRGKVDEEFLNMIVNDERWIKFMEEYPKIFRNSYGMSKQEINQIGHASQYKKNVKAVTKAGDKNITVAESMEQSVKDAGSKVNILENVSEQARRAKKAGSSADNFLPMTAGKGDESALLANELTGAGDFGGDFTKWLDAIKAKGETNGAYRSLHWMLTEPMNAYQRIDASYRLGTAVHLTTTGITERELLTLSRFLKIDPRKDLIHAAEENLWKLTPERATEASLEMFLNYGAMPEAVKVLRSLPFFGAPFASFMYGMAAKTGKTLVNNPSVFNKIQFLLQEISGEISPLERYAMEEDYYSWFKRAGMVKLPFFQDNPIYLNVANMLPYYTMNMFQPSERNYSNTLSSGVASIVDKMPIFKTPEGQVMFDYFIQPVILRESQPVGMFDQVLWPVDASGFQKFGYGARAMAESVVPPVSGLAGLITPESMLEFMPNFRGRQLGYAKEGKTSVGVMGKEAPLSRVGRNLSSMAGFPLYPLNTGYTAKEFTKNNK